MNVRRMSRENPGYPSRNVVRQYRLDRKDPSSFARKLRLDDGSQLAEQLLERAPLRVHDRVAACERKGAVMVADRPEGGKSDGDRLPPSVHRRWRAVDVDELIRVEDRSIHLDFEP